MDLKADDPKSQVENGELIAEQEPLSKKEKKKKKKRLPPVQAKVQILRDHPEKIPPLVGYFPSGYSPQISPDNESEDGSDSTRVGVYRNKNMPKRLQLVVSPAGSSVDFVGTSYSGEAAAGQRCLYALGVLDKETQTLKVVPIAANKVFRLDPRVKGVEYTDKGPKGEISERKADNSKRLINLFGTKKDQEKVRKVEAFNQADDPDSQKSLDVKMKSVAVNKQALESTDAHISHNIPPYNVAATTPQEAYLLDKIILKGDWDYLEDIFNLLYLEQADFSAYPTFICQRIERLREIQDETEKKQLCCIFSYINHLIKFKELHSLDGFSSAKGHKIPSILRHRFSTMFGGSDKKTLPSEKIKLLISYVLVLTLFVDDFRTDFSGIAKDLRMTEVALRPYYENLGCKISRKNNVNYATLNVPLEFPTTRLRKRRR
ncbi:hypothetical protein L6164_021428 [Bauhinia variegata]|uniref:Uncharacterized protein n=1 Tax=Bauhinia variegata TaxID=167791 RepID=A0ACB9MZU6_BAUVA|nr:hypothetical protein L6164_021428 [Bauhinia variegata]